MPSHLQSGPPSEDTDAYRVSDAARVSIDTFAGHWLVQTREADFPEGADQIQLWGAKSCWWKKLDARRQEPPRWMAGEKLEAPFPAREHGVTYEISLQSGYSQGLFLDQRLNRLAVRERVRPGDRILNTFAYTCGFSVVAARAGGIATSVDLSKGYLEWGKRNLALNDLDPADHYFTLGDTFDWLRRWRKSGVRFGGLILDPPTFSRNESGKVFRVETDYGALVELAMGVLEPGGWMLCCTNFRGMNTADFGAVVASAAPRARLGTRAMPPEFHASDYLKSIWMET